MINFFESKPRSINPRPIKRKLNPLNQEIILINFKQKNMLLGLHRTLVLKFNLIIISNQPDSSLKLWKGKENGKSWNKEWS